MLTNDLTKFGKCKKHPILIDLKKYYYSKNVVTSWCAEKLVLSRLGWYTTEIGSLSFPCLYIVFHWKEKNLTLKIKANTLAKLISKLECRYPELLFKESK